MAMKIIKATSKLMRNNKTARATYSTLKTEERKEKIKKEKKVRADFLKDFSKARGVERGCGGRRQKFDLVEIYEKVRTEFRKG